MDKARFAYIEDVVVAAEGSDELRDMLESRRFALMEVAHEDRDREEGELADSDGDIVAGVVEKPPTAK